MEQNLGKRNFKMPSIPDICHHCSCLHSTYERYYCLLTSDSSWPRMLEILLHIMSHISSKIRTPFPFIALNDPYFTNLLLKTLLLFTPPAEKSHGEVSCYRRQQSVLPRWTALSGKVKLKCTLVQALRLCTGRSRNSRSIALLFHD